MIVANRLSLKYFKGFLISPFWSSGYLKTFLKSVLCPIDYTRTKEIPALLDCSGILDRNHEPLEVLDIGSPQILSLALAVHAPSWKITYINPYEPELEDLRRKVDSLGIGNLAATKADITNTEAVSELGLYDVIMSCSVFEHIHPEEGGDKIAALNVSRLLKDKGVFAFSVPCAKQRFNEYVDGDVYAVKSHGEKVFFQRFYDKDSLYNQIVEPSKLKLFGVNYIGEKYYHEDNIKKRLALKIGYGWRSYLFGRFFGLISRIFMESSNDIGSLKKPYLAIGRLDKR